MELQKWTRSYHNPTTDGKLVIPQHVYSVVVFLGTKTAAAAVVVEEQHQLTKLHEQ